MSKSKLKERQWQVREETILDAASELLNEQGYVEISMDAVAAACGISKATLYQHFASKDDLIVQVVACELQRARAFLQTLNPSELAIVQIEKVLKRNFRQRARLWGGSMQGVPLKVTEHPAFQEQYEQLTVEMRRLIDTAKEQGDISPSLPTPVILALLRSIFSSRYDDVFSTENCSVDELSDTLLSIFLDGVRLHK